MIGSMASSFTIFDTAIGPCAVAWNDIGLTRVGLPEGSAAATRARLVRGLRGESEAVETGPTADVRRAIDAVVALLAGEWVDLAFVELDLAGVPEFNRQVYAVTRAIPVGSTLSYGEVARRIGRPGAAQAVGRALGANPWPIVVPCHRVLAADGSMHGFSANGGVETKRRMLLIEGAAGVDPTLF